MNTRKPLESHVQSQDPQTDTVTHGKVKICIRFLSCYEIEQKLRTWETQQ